jgi:hypothetical protein
VVLLLDPEPDHRHPYGDRGDAGRFPDVSYLESGRQSGPVLSSACPQNLPLLRIAVQRHDLLIVPSHGSVRTPECGARRRRSPGLSRTEIPRTLLHPPISLWRS